jgi:hypothetical protein
VPDELRRNPKRGALTMSSILAVLFFVVAFSTATSIFIVIADKITDGEA